MGQLYSWYHPYAWWLWSVDMLSCHLADEVLIDTRAHKDFRSDLRMAGVSEADLLTGPLGRDAVCYRAAHIATERSDPEISAARLARYQQILAAIVVGAPKPEVVNLDKRDQYAKTVNPANLFFGFGLGKGGA